jgi:glycolate oxidase FAD binding subunit
LALECHGLCYWCATQIEHSDIIELRLKTLRPETPKQLADSLHDLAAERRPIQLVGLGAPPADSEAVVTTAAMTRLLQYEPRDLTVSVEAGMPFAELERTLAERGQMLPLDPPAGSTVGGVIATNLSGPRRRLYGTARDMVIGMTFATLEGKLIDSGGMVVKNVAGLDMAKLMIGSFGTLAAIATVNFKVFPIPAQSRTFVMGFATARDAFAERDRILRGILQPSAIDLVNWPSGFRLLVRAGGNDAVLARYAAELPAAKAQDESLWDDVREFTPRFLAEHPRGGVVSISTALTEMLSVVENLDVPFIARAGSGVIYAHYAENPPEVALGGDFAMMKKVKDMFDPEHLLNRGRLYGRL